ncbi:hypothetical protein CHELA1G11_20626 [Hyphomicrobiales bacterium]|nr:hypothetical protein CHELA1G11_20626 [Hyphomicrobiales bacterium]CAH1691123.1 hypothetical protein CHELA1G2_20940 [Hyphomicrobiales bacterium]
MRAVSETWIMGRGSWSNGFPYRGRSRQTLQVRMAFTQAVNDSSSLVVAVLGLEEVFLARMSRHCICRRCGRSSSI